jgi:nucleotide-binding universal stress UspA family protein
MGAGLVLGFDDSAAAREALAVAVDLAGRLGEPLHVAFAAQPPTLVGEEAGAHAEALDAMGEGLVAEALATARAAGVEAFTHVVRERPADLLLRLAEEHEARMIVVGSYGESPLRGAVLGSTSHKLVHLSERPVLAVPAPR